MSRDIYITITGAGGSSASGAAGARSATGSTDPGEDLTQAPVSNPGEDLTQAPVSNPGEDLTQAPVSNPDQIALAVALAKALGDSPSARALQVQGSSGKTCCCSGSQEKGDPATGLALKLEHSGFIIVRMRPAFSPEAGEDWTLIDLAKRYHPALEGLRTALLQSGSGPNENGPDENALSITDDQLAAGPYLSTWPLIVSCSCQAAAGPSEPIPASSDCRNRVRELEAEAAKTRLPPLHSLANYWRVDARSLGAGATALVARLNERSEVDLAYRELAATDPGWTTSFDDDQTYLEEAPNGIGARCIPSLASPASIRLVDLEQGWHADHQNLGIEQAQILGGANRAKNDPSQGHHGTAVVGEWVGRKDSGANPSVQVEGILPGTPLDLASHYFGSDAPDLSLLQDHQPPTVGGPLTHTNGHVANAMVATLGYHFYYQNPPSLILLLEVQRSLLPTEVDPADFDAIRLATALGVTVVEAAGNGGENLDAYTDPRGIRVLHRGGNGFQDSGAILTGASWSALPHNRAYFSNFGSRVDCYAWGDRVTTCGYGDLYGEAVTDFYTGSFSGTSSASPIIAGAAGLLQGLAKESTGVPLPPLRLRDLLANPATGTPQGPDIAGAIGVMPNLKAILAETLCVGPDVYVRNNPCDDGSAPPPEDLTSCPDIIVHNKLLTQAEAQEKFGEQGPWAHAVAVGFPGNVGTPKYLYVRLRNEGLQSSDVHLDLYGARPATLLTPHCWQRLDTNHWVEATVHQGDQLTVTGPLQWKPDDTPMFLQTGDYSAFMAVERVPDPKPTTPEHIPQDLPPDGKYFQLKDLLSFYRQKTVGVRNVHIVPPGWPPAQPLVFDLTSTPGQARRYDFEIFQRLPEGVTATLELERSLEAKLRKSSSWIQLGAPEELTGTSTDDDRVLLHLPPGPCLRFEDVPLPAGVCAGIQLRFEGPQASLERGYGFAIRQLYRGVEIGRITWLFREKVGGS